MVLGETVLEVMSTHADEDGWAAGEHPPSLPSPRFVLKGPASRQAVAIARSMAQKGARADVLVDMSVWWHAGGGDMGPTASQQRNRHAHLPSIHQCLTPH